LSVARHWIPFPALSDRVRSGQRGCRESEKQTLLQIDAEMKPRLCTEKYPEKFAGKYRQRCLQMRRDLHEHVFLHLISDLYLDLSLDLDHNLSLDLDHNLNLDLSLNLNLCLFLKSFALMFE
jgi:hypothetical protein